LQFALRLSPHHLSLGLLPQVPEELSLIRIVRADSLGAFFHESFDISGIEGQTQAGSQQDGCGE
jgi:hypothetical protein